MKKILVIVLGILSFSVMADAAIDCYKTGQADPVILDQLGIRHLSVLCAEAPNAQSPIDCFKAGVEDSFLLGILYPKHIAALCQRAYDEMPLECYRTAHDDSTVSEWVSELRMIELCSGARSLEPVECFLEHVNEDGSNSQVLVRLCRQR